jgi:hypothetical protein
MSDTPPDPGLRLAKRCHSSQHKKQARLELPYPGLQFDGRAIAWRAARRQIT